MIEPRVTSIADGYVEVQILNLSRSEATIAVHLGRRDVEASRLLASGRAMHGRPGGGVC